MDDNTPRWLASQRAIELSLSDGPKSVPELIQATGYSRSTVNSALKRARVVTNMGWPRTFTLVETYDSGKEFAPEVPVQVKLVHLVDPAPIPTGELGPRWQEARVMLGKNTSAIDLGKLSLTDAKAHFREVAATILGVLVALDDVKDGPDWLDQIGL